MPVRLRTDRIAFPSPDQADALGLVAVGGDLSVPRLLEAYRNGIFPWPAEGEPLSWWSPDPRMILEPVALHVSRSLRAVLRKRAFDVRVDTAFAAVLHACATAERPGESGTWIIPAIERAYTALFEQGYAHSVECWQAGALVGGLYGVCLGRCFFGESMFSARPEASKVALVALCALLRGRGIGLIDCQVASPHLERLGARAVPRAEFLDRLRAALSFPTDRGRWAPAPGPGGPPDAWAAPRSA